METTKRCPYCGEEIKAAAKKCRFCNEWLVDDAIETALKEEQVQFETDNSVKSEIPEKAFCDNNDVNESIVTESNAKSRTQILKKGNSIYWILGAVIIILLVYAIKTCGNSEAPVPMKMEEKESTTTTATAFTPYLDVSSAEEVDKEAVENAVSKRIEELYTEVFSARLSSVELMEVFLTKDFRRIYYDALAKGIENGENVLNHDLWYQAQSWNNVSMKIDSIEPSTHEGYAWAYIDLIDGSHHNKVHLTMVYEDGNWQVANINKDKDYLKQYLSTHKNSNPQSTSSQNNASISSNSIWEYGYLQNEFGESMRNCPYLYGEIENGDEYFTFRVSDCEGIIVGYHRMFDSMDLIEASKLSIKAQNGQIYRFDFIKRNSSLYITDQDQMKTFLNLLIQGHFIMSVGFPSGNAYILRVNDETCDIQRVWDSFNN